LKKQTRTTINNNIINQIITLRAEGKTQNEIARLLNIAQPTVSVYSNKPEIKSVTEKLRETLQNKHTTRFTTRKIREEKKADLLSRIALGDEVDNKTMYQDVDSIEKFLARQDKSGLIIAKGVGILDTNTIRFGDDNSQHLTVISPSYQKFLDFQNNNPYDDDGNLKVKSKDL
jgi:predicted transcriptional regulator